jgi:hypothetical protein
MAALLSARFPGKASELWAYQAIIVRTERDYEGKQWVSYDRQFRREALARKDLNWSVTDPRLFNEAFTGRARAIPRCAYCLQDEHTSQACPHNPSRMMLSCPPPPDPSTWLQPQIPQQPSLTRPPSMTPPHRPQPTSLLVSQWLQRYSLMAALLSAHFPGKASELWE